MTCGKCPMNLRNPVATSTMTSIHCHRYHLSSPGFLITTPTIREQLDEEEAPPPTSTHHESS